MTKDQRSILEHLADPTLCVLGMKYIEAVGAALNEIDRQWAELAALKAEPPRPAALTWTTENPTEPGWYWVRLVPGYGGRDWNPRISQVAIDPRSGVLTGIERTGPWHWAGPIPEPVERKEGTDVDHQASR